MALLHSLALRPRLVLGGLFILSLLAFLALIPVPRIDGKLIGSDGLYYFAYAHTLVFDGDLDFTNEYAALNIPPTSPRPTLAGWPANKYAIGPALLWMPWYLAAHLIALIANVINPQIAADGYSYIYQAAISIGSITYGAIGIALAYRCACRLGSALAALIAVTLLWMASNLPYYMIFEPSMPHMLSLLCVSLLLTIWFERVRHADHVPMGIWLLLGTAAGAVVLVRTQDAPYILIPIGSIMWQIIRSFRSGNWVQTRSWLIGAALASIMALLVFLPQMLAWKILYGGWIVNPYADDRAQIFFWLQPKLYEVLFSPFHGLFTWHPIYLAAITGLISLAGRQRTLALGLLAILAIETYLIGSWWSWWQGDSFGGRMFIGATWIWAIGLAALIEQIRIKQIAWPALVTALFLILWNGLALAQYRLGFIPMGLPPTWQQLTIERILLPLRILARLRGKA